MARARIAHEVDSAKIEENANSPELKTFALTLNALLTEKNIHQNAMANDIGIAPGSITNYRNGIKEPRLSTIVKIAKYLDVDCNYLMTGIQAENSTIAADLNLSNRSISHIQLFNSIHPHRFREGLNLVLESGMVGDLFRHISRLKRYIALVKDIFSRSSDDDFANAYSQSVSMRRISRQTLNGIEEIQYRRQMAINCFTEMLDNMTNFSEFMKESRDRATRIAQTQNKKEGN